MFIVKIDISPCNMKQAGVLKIHVRPKSTMYLLSYLINKLKKIFINLTKINLREYTRIYKDS